MVAWYTYGSDLKDIQAIVMFSLWQISLILHTTVTEAEIVIVKPPGRPDESDPLLAQCYLCDLVSLAGRENNLARGSSFQRGGLAQCQV